MNFMAQEYFTFIFPSKDGEEKVPLIPSPIRMTSYRALFWICLLKLQRIHFIHGKRTGKNEGFSPKIHFEFQIYIGRNRFETKPNKRQFRSVGN